MINSSDTTKTREIPVADLHKTFSDQITTLDPQRAQSVTDLASVRSAKAATLTHEQNLLTRKLGANDPRIAALALQQTQNTALQTSLTAEGIRAQTPAPVASASSYIFHGYVFDSNSQPLSRLTVALYDDQGQWIQETGYGCTDENGYFLMRYDNAKQPTPAPAPTPKPPVPAPPQPTPDPITGKISHAAKTNVVNPIHIIVEKPNPTHLFSANILVFDQQQKLLYTDPTPLQPKLGQVDYRIITIGDNAGTCTPPPGGTSPVAPGQKSEVITPIRDIASLRKQASAKSSAPAKPSSSAGSSKSSRPAASAKHVATKPVTSKRSLKKPTAKKSAAPKRKPAARKKKKSR